MKNQIFKSCLLLLGVSAIFTSCVKTDDLDSVSQLQTVTAKQKLADAKAKDLSSQQNLADKVFNLKTQVADLKADLLKFKADSNQVQFLIRENKMNYSSDSASAATNKQILAVWKNTLASANYQVSIDSLYALLTTSKANLEKKNLTYSQASDLYDTQAVISDNAAKLYSSVLNDKSNAAIDTANALSGYNSIADLKLNINATSSLVTLWANNVANFSVTVNKFLVLKTASSAKNDIAYADYLAARNIIDNVVIGGSTPSQAQYDARDNAFTIYNTANNTYNTDSGNYAAAVSELSNATDNLDFYKSNLKQLQDNETLYNTAKPLYTAAVAKLPALLTSKETEAAKLVTVNAAYSTAATAQSAAQAIVDAQSNGIDVLVNGKDAVVSAISGYSITQKNLESSMQTELDNLAQLAAGYNFNIIIADYVAATNAKIKAYEATIASYEI